VSLGVRREDLFALGGKLRSTGKNNGESSAENGPGGFWGTWLLPVAGKKGG